MTDDLLRGVVPELLGPSGPVRRLSTQVAERGVEYEALVQLLMDHASRPGAETRDVAMAMAAGCLGEQHMWRDMGLSDRAVLRALFETYFAPLAARNDRDMRWKRFLYKCLCRWEGFHVCRAPTCAECSSHAECFSPED